MKLSPLTHCQPSVLSLQCHSVCTIVDFIFVGKSLVFFSFSFFSSSSSSSYFGWNRLGKLVMMKTGVWSSIWSKDWACRECRKCWCVFVQTYYPLFCCWSWHRRGIRRTRSTVVLSMVMIFSFPHFRLLWWSREIFLFRWFDWQINCN